MGSSRGMNSIKLIRNGRTTTVNSVEPISNRKPALDRMRFDENQRPTPVPSWVMLDRIVREEFPEMNPDKFIVDQVEPQFDKGYRQDLGQMLKIMSDYKRLYGFKLDGFRPFSQHDMDLIKGYYVDELGQDAEKYAEIPPMGIFYDDGVGQNIIAGEHTYLVYDPLNLPHRRTADSREGREWSEEICPAAEMLPSTRQTYQRQLDKLMEYRKNRQNGNVVFDSRFAKLSEDVQQSLEEWYRNQLEEAGDTDSYVNGYHLDPVRNLSCTLAHEMGHLIMDSVGGQKSERYRRLGKEAFQLPPMSEYAKVCGEEAFAEFIAYAAVGMLDKRFSRLLKKFNLPEPPTGFIKFNSI